ncbi:MAG: hypothetical protein RSE12_08460 [Fuscovulum sp.]|nr:MAG: hypothetical protein RSE12_08460 [Fuscovulum sp.]
MRKYLGVAFACLPAVLPDAFSLAREWSLFGFLVSGAALLAYWKLPNLKSLIPQEKRDEAVLLLSVIFVSCFVMFGHRAVSGVTVTAAYAQDVGETLAGVAGTEERFKAMTEELRNRLEALERLASLEAALQNAERRAQDAERAAAQNERLLQEAERQAAEEEREAAERERALENAERQIAAAARLAEEQARLLEAKERELQKAYRDAEATKSAEATRYVNLSPRSMWFQLETELSTFDLENLANNPNVEDPAYWENVDPSDLVLVDETIEVLVVAGIERDLEVAVEFRDLEGNVLTSAATVTQRREFTKVAEDVYEAYVSLEASLPASAVKSGTYVWCATARDLQTDETWNDGAAADFSVVEQALSLNGEENAFKTIPYMLENTYGQVGGSVNVSQVCE